MPRCERGPKRSRARSGLCLSLPALCQHANGALVRAHESGVAAYDTLFVELAVRERLPPATFDAALLKAFPKIAARPAALMRK